LDFSLSEEQVAIFDLAQQFGQEKIAPHSLDWEKSGNIPKTLWKDIASLGFWRLICFREKWWIRLKST